MEIILMKKQLERLISRRYDLVISEILQINEILATKKSQLILFFIYKIKFQHVKVSQPKNLDTRR